MVLVICAKFKNQKSIFQVRDLRAQTKLVMCRSKIEFVFRLSLKSQEHGERDLKTLLFFSSKFWPTHMYVYIENLFSCFYSLRGSLK